MDSEVKLPPMCVVDADAEPDPAVAARGWAALAELFAQAIKGEKKTIPPPTFRVCGGGQRKKDGGEW